MAVNASELIAIKADKYCRKRGFCHKNRLPTTLSLATNSVSAATPLITNLQFAPFGGPKSWNWVMNARVNGGSVAHSRSFDTNGRLIRYPLGEHLRDVTYDAAGRITAYAHYLAASGATTGSPAPAQNQQFSYDALERLTQATTSQASWTYTYDANGNRTSVKVNSGTPNAYTVSPTSNRLTNIASPAITLTHDVMGNIVSDGTYTLTYDLRGRLTTTTQGGTTTTYAYDNNGQRVRKFNNQGTQNTVLFVYDQSGQLLGEYDSTGQAIREYVWLGNMPIAMFMSDPAQGANAQTATPLIYYIHADHLNAPRVVVDKTNTMRWRWMGEPFGTTAPETSPAGLAALTFNLRFSGQFFDQESGMFYNAQRDYVPGIGRYAQSDPIGLAGGINTYGYSGANPVMNSDPTGEAFSFFGLLNRLVPPVPVPTPVPVVPVNPTEPAGPGGAPSTPAIPVSPIFSVPIGIAGGVVSTVVKTIVEACTPGDPCQQLNDAVQRAKDKVGSFSPARCEVGMSKFDIKARADAWLDEATARSKRDQICWEGGDAGHQQAQASAWLNVGRCQGMLR